MSISAVSPFAPGNLFSPDVPPPSRPEPARMASSVWDNGRGIRITTSPGDDPGVTRFEGRPYTVNGRPVGIVYGLIDDKGQAHINWIKIDDDKQGSGAGSALLAGVIEWARSQGANTLTIRANDDVKGWYGRAGFSETPGGVTRFGEDAVEYNMRRSL